MALEEIERYSQYSDDEIYSDKNGTYCRFDNVESLYKYQQDIIKKLVSNTQSQYETNQVLVNRLLELKSWLSDELEKRKEDLESYEDTDDEEFGYLRGVLKGLKLVTEKLN